MPTSTTDPSETGNDDADRWPVRPASGLGSPRFRPEHPGTIVGYVQRRIKKQRVEVPIYSAGAVKVADELIVLGVVPHWRHFFAVRGVEVQRLPVSLPRSFPRAKAPPKDPDFVSIWADLEARRFMEVAVNNDDNLGLLGVRQRYCKLVQTLVHQKLVDLAAIKVERDPGDFAKGCSLSWTTDHLMRPREVTIRHAVYVSLVLALKPEEAGVLISRAAYIQLEMPVVDENLAAKMYSHASTVLTRGCPTWWERGVATPWKGIGTSIDLVFRAMFGRAIAEANARDVPFEHLLGTSLDRMLLGAE